MADSVTTADSAVDHGGAEMADPSRISLLSMMCQPGERIDDDSVRRSFEEFGNLDKWWQKHGTLLLSTRKGHNILTLEEADAAIHSMMYAYDFFKYGDFMFRFSVIVAQAVIRSLMAHCKAGTIEHCELAVDDLVDLLTVRNGQHIMIRCDSKAVNTERNEIVIALMRDLVTICHSLNNRKLITSIEAQKADYLQKGVIDVDLIARVYSEDPFKDKEGDLKD